MNNSRWKSTLITLFLTLLISVTLGTSLCSYKYYLAAIGNHKIIGGIKFNNIDLTGYTYSKVEALVESRNAQLLKKPIELSYGKYRTTLQPNDILAKTNYQAVMASIFKENEGKGVLFQLKKVLNFPPKSKNYILSVSYDRNALAESVEDIKRKFSVIPVNAKIYARNKKIIIEPEIIGKKLNYRKLNDKVSIYLAAPLYSKKQIAIPFDDIIPKITAAKLNNLKITDLISSFQTTYDVNNIGRSENIQTGTGKINSQILHPNEIFSFNKIVGPRTMQNGYRQAPEIVNGKLQPGIGGGICQVATTLYNAVLLAELKVLKRAPHSRPLHYVPVGLDATVSYNSIDFAFQNTLPFPIMISMYAQNGILITEIYALKKDPTRSVEVYTTDLVEYPYKTITQDDHKMFNCVSKVIQEGINGYSVTVWRSIKVKGQEISKEIISKDRYKPVDMIVVTGTKE